MAVTLYGKPASCGVSNKSREETETIPVHKPRQIGGTDTENMAMWIGWDDRMGRTSNQSRGMRSYGMVQPHGGRAEKVNPVAAWSA